jgi:hypothetical protein
MNSYVKPARESRIPNPVVTEDGNLPRHAAAQALGHEPSVAKFALLPGDLAVAASAPQISRCWSRRSAWRSDDLVTYDFSNDGRVNALDVAARARLITPHYR